MSFLIGLAAAATVLFQTQYVAMSLVWALIHGAGVTSFRSLLPTASALGVLWAGWFVIKYKAGSHRHAITLAYSIAVVAAVEAIAPITPLKAHLQQQAIDHVQVMDVSDEPLRSANGRLIGIRLAYDAIFPRAGVYSISPSQYSLLSGQSELYPLQFGRFLRQSIDPEPSGVVGEPGQRSFAADTRYHFVFDAVPNFLFYDESRNSYCVSIQPNTNYSRDEVISALSRAESAQRRTSIEVDGPTSFTKRFVITEYTTRRSYNVKDIYDGAISEGAATCEF